MKVSIPEDHQAVWVNEDAIDLFVSVDILITEDNPRGLVKFTAIRDDKAAHGKEIFELMTTKYIDQVLPKE